MKLRDFNESDWYGFAGCESKNPKIGEVILKGRYGRKLDGLVIIDNVIVQYHFYSKIFHKTFTKEFKNLTHEDVVTIIKSYPKEIDHDFFIKNGFDFENL